MTARDGMTAVPIWARSEPHAVQQIIVIHALTGLQLRTLREFATAELDTGTREARRISHSLALALRKRGLGELTGTHTPGRLDRRHPVATFQLNETGWGLARQTIVNDECHESEREPSVSYRNEYGGRWDRQRKPPRAKNPQRHPAEWDE